jgi:hypothetical protein
VEQVIRASSSEPAPKISINPQNQVTEAQVETARQQIDNPERLHSLYMVAMKSAASAVPAQQVELGTAAPALPPALPTQIVSFPPPKPFEPPQHAHAQQQIPVIYSRQIQGMQGSHSPPLGHTAHIKATPSVMTMSDTLQALTHNQEITLEMLQAHFHLPLVEAARAFNICITRLKKICRNHGIKRWPCRQVQCALKAEKCSVEELNAMAMPQRAYFNMTLLPSKPRALYISAVERLEAAGELAMASLLKRQASHVAGVQAAALQILPVCRI